MQFSQINMPLVVAVSMFLAICLLILGIILFIRQKQQRVAMLKKIEVQGDEWIFSEKKSQEASLTGAENTQPGLVRNLIRKIGAKTNPNRTIDDIDIKLKFLRAGIRDRNSPTAFWGVKFLLGLTFPMIFAAFVIITNSSLRTSHLLLIGGFLGMIGLFLPDYWLWKKTMIRRNKIVKGFPDALDMLVVCVEAGMGLDSAMNRVGLELELGQPEISEEFKFLNLELRAGKARSAALKSMGERINVDEVNSLVTLLLQTDRFGTSVGQALRVYSDTFRTQRYQRAEEIAAKLPTKLIFPMVTCIFPAMFTVILGPAVIQIYRVIINPS